MTPHNRSRITNLGIPAKFNLDLGTMTKQLEEMINRSDGDYKGYSRDKLEIVKEYFDSSKKSSAPVEELLKKTADLFDINHLKSQSKSDMAEESLILIYMIMISTNVLNYIENDDQNLAKNQQAFTKLFAVTQDFAISRLFYPRRFCDLAAICISYHLIDQYLEVKKSKAFRFKVDESYCVIRDCHEYTDRKKCNQNIFFSLITDIAIDFDNNSYNKEKACEVEEEIKFILWDEVLINDGFLSDNRL